MRIQSWVPSRPEQAQRTFLQLEYGGVASEALYVRKRHGARNIVCTTVWRASIPVFLAAARTERLANRGLAKRRGPDLSSAFIEYGCDRHHDLSSIQVAGEIPRVACPYVTFTKQASIGDKKIHVLQSTVKCHAKLDLFG